MMEKRAQERFERVLARAAADPEYQRLRRKCDELDQAVLAVLEKLSDGDRAVVRDYIRALGASALRLTELTCEDP